MGIMTEVDNMPKLNGKKQIIVSESKALEPGGFIEVVNIKEPLVVDELTWAGQSKLQTQILIEVYTSLTERTSIGELSGEGYTRGFTPQNITEHGSWLFDTIVFDDDANRYRFKLKKPMYFAYGLRIRIYNDSSDTSYQMGMRLLGRVVQ